MGSLLDPNRDSRRSAKQARNYVGKGSRELQQAKQGQAGSYEYILNALRDPKLLETLSPDVVAQILARQGEQTRGSAQDIYKQFATRQGAKGAGGRSGAMGAGLRRVATETGGQLADAERSLRVQAALQKPQDVFNLVGAYLPVLQAQNQIPLAMASLFSNAASGQFGLAGQQYTRSGGLGGLMSGLGSIAGLMFGGGGGIGGAIGGMMGGGGGGGGTQAAMGGGGGGGSIAPPAVSYSPPGGFGTGGMGAGVPYMGPPVPPGGWQSSVVPQWNPGGYQCDEGG